MIHKTESLEAHFSELVDPRRDPGRNHLLIEIIIMAVVAVIGGANDWVFSLLSPEAFQRCFINWVRAMADLKVGEVVVLDARHLRQPHDRWHGKEVVTMLNVCATEAGLALGTRDVAEDTSEITALPEILKLLVLVGCIVTADAAHCQAENTRQVTEQGADYVLALKANQSGLYGEVEQAFTAEQARRFSGARHETLTTQERNHGWIETRRHVLLTDPEYLDYFNREGKWWGLAAVGMVERTREVNGRVERQTRYYYITTLSGDAKLSAVEVFARAVRSHWHVENKLHWVLDVVFREDESCARMGRVSENFSVICQMALNLLRLDDTPRLSLTSNRLRAGCDNEFLLKVMSGAVA